MPQPLHLPGPLPDQRLVGPGHHHRATVARHRPQLVGVGAHHVGQHVRVTGVALGPGHAVPLPVPRRLQRVHREHRVPGRDQRRDPRAAVSLGPDDHLRILTVLTRCSRIKACSRAIPATSAAAASPAPGPSHPSAPRRDGPQPSHPLQTTASISHPKSSDLASSLQENNQRPNETVLTPARRARHPSSDQLSRTPAGARSVTRTQSPGPISTHLPAATHTRVCRTADPLTPIRAPEGTAGRAVLRAGGPPGGRSSGRAVLRAGGPPDGRTSGRADLRTGGRGTTHDDPVRRRPASAGRRR